MRAHTLAVSLLVVLLQVQATLPVGDAGVRIALSDIFLPLLFVAAIAIGWWRFPDAFEARLPGTAYWFLGLIAVLTLSLVIGFVNTKQWLAWAIVNKWIGFFLLVAYFVAGVAIVRAGDLASRNQVLRAFLVSAAAIAAINGVAMPWLMPEYSLPVGIEFSRATGLMQNANAYGFFLVVVTLLAIAMRYHLWLCLPSFLLAMWFTSSRGALLALIAGIAVFLALSPRRMKDPLRPMALAVLLIGTFSVLVGYVDHRRVSAAAEGYGPIGYLSAERVDPESNSIAQRWRQTAGAIELIAEAPVFGHGLGYVLKTTGQTIHNSLLWLVVETGFVGAAVFTVFLVLAVRQLFLDRDDPFVLGMVAVSGAFMVMSLTGEYLYQRHLWFLLGVALAQTPDQQVAA